MCVCIAQGATKRIKKKPQKIKEELVTENLCDTHTHIVKRVYGFESESGLLFMFIWHK
jgi:hypothetical protein